MSTKIKICGLFRPEDIEAVNIAKPDYVGFIFYPKSHRYVTAERAKALRAGLDPSIKAVGVFVNSGTDEAAGIIRTASLDIAQLHGDETDEDICRLRQECPMLAQVWKAIRIKDGFNIGSLSQYSSADKLVLDAYVEGYGGAGKSFDLNLIKGVDPKRIILAGGLNHQNIREAINTVRPWGVDLSSGVETHSKKDKDKIINIVNLIRNAR